MGTAIVIVIIVVICVFAIYSYGHKMRHGGGCCGSHEAAEKKVKVADKNKDHYPDHRWNDLLQLLPPGGERAEQLGRRLGQGRPRRA